MKTFPRQMSLTSQHVIIVFMSLAHCQINFRHISLKDYLLYTHLSISKFSRNNLFQSLSTKYTNILIRLKKCLVLCDITHKIYL